MAKAIKSIATQRTLTAFDLMKLAAEAHSDSNFKTSIEVLGFKVIPEYSHGDLSKTGYCCVSVVNVNKPQEIFMLSRGFPWHKMDAKGVLEEMKDIMAAVRSKEPDGVKILKQKLQSAINSDAYKEITIIGHSRGGLVVDHVAAKPLLIPDNISVEMHSVESPGVNNLLPVENPNYTQYRSDFHGIINSCATPIAKKLFVIKNTPPSIKGKNFIDVSAGTHGMESLCKAMHKGDVCEQESSSRGSTNLLLAFGKFVKKGGKADLKSLGVVMISDAIKNSPILIECIDVLMQPFNHNNELQAKMAGEWVEVPPDSYDSSQASDEA